MKTNKKWLIFPLTVLIVACLCFTLYSSHNLVLEFIFTGRASEYSLLDNDWKYQVRKNWRDYPSLANREEIDFWEGGDKHHGYFYEADSPKGLILLVHGYGSLSDGHEAALADYFYRDSWRVFQVDLTASGTDEDKRTEGLECGPGDVAETIRYLQKEERFSIYRESLCLMGYSWGGYSVGAALTRDFEYAPKAVVSFAGFNSTVGEMLALAKKHVGGFADFLTPFFKIGMLQNRGDQCFASAASGFNHYPDCKVILVQGEQDDTVPADSAAIWNYADKIENPSRLIRYSDGLIQRDHYSIWYSDEAYEYYANEARSEYSSLLAEYGSRSAIPEEKIQAMKQKSSVVDEEMLHTISEQFVLAVA